MPRTYHTFGLLHWGTCDGIVALMSMSAHEQRSGYPRGTVIRVLLQGWQLILRSGGPCMNPWLSMWQGGTGRRLRLKLSRRLLSGRVVVARRQRVVRVSSIRGITGSRGGESLYTVETLVVLRGMTVCLVAGGMNRSGSGSLCGSLCGQWMVKGRPRLCMTGGPSVGGIVGGGGVSSVR